LTPDEVKNHPLFKKLTVKQQTFVSEMLANGGDQIKAALAAYDCNGKDSARAMANRQMDHPNIAWLIEAYFESDPASVAFTRETALSFAAKKARTASDAKMALDYFKIAVEMSGWRVKPAEPDAPAAPAQDPNATISI
jgi:hypothetical protein